MRASIVVPTHDRSQLLDSTLTALANQHVPSTEFEVIVIDHGSIDNTWETVQRHKSTLSLRYEKIRREDYNASKPRNVGINLAQGELAIFLDSGLVVGPDFVQLHCQAHEHSRSPGCYCIGRTLGPMREDDWLAGHDFFDVAGCVQQFKSIAGFDDPRRPHIHANHPAPWIFFWSDNCSVPTDALRQLGGFDETVNGWGFEDLELGYRLHKHGLEFISQEAWAVHLPHPRAPLFERFAESGNKWRHALAKHCAIEMEIFSVSDIPLYSETLLHVRAVASQVQTPDYLAPEQGGLISELVSLVEGPALVIGTASNLALPATSVTAWLHPGSDSTAARIGATQGIVYPLLGLQTPFRSKQFRTAIITDYWKQLGGKPGPGRPSYLLYLMAQASRVADKVFIIDTHDFSPSVPVNWLASRTDLKEAINAVMACPIEKPASFSVVPKTLTGFWEVY